MPNGEEHAEINRRLQDLVAFPREDLSIELKPWLDLAASEGAANLGHALLALANHGGGYVLIGFAEAAGAWQPVDGRPDSLAGYGQDVVNGIVARYAEPRFHCDVHQVEHPESGDPFPVVVVPGGHRVPIRAKADDPDRRHIRVNTYYIRRPGPCSEAPQTAQEWDELISRCIRANREDLLESVRAVLETPRGALPFEALEHRAGSPLDEWIEDSRNRFETLLDEEYPDEEPRTRYQHGVYTFAYAIDGDFEPPELPALLQLLQRVQGHETGWPPWLVVGGDKAPRPYEGTAEAWFFKTTFADPAHSDYWRASPRGLLYQIQGYDDDGMAGHVVGRFPPGEHLDFILPIWRLSPALLHAARLADALGDATARVEFRVTWEGLRGRYLSAWAQPGRYFPPDRRPAVQDRVESGVSVRADQISDTLPELLSQLLGPLYAVFDFFTMPPENIRAQVAELRGR
jgi:hypothetical protein